MHLNPKDKKTIGVTFCILFCLHITGWLLWGEIALVIFLSMTMVVFVLIQMDNYRSIQQQFQRQDYRHKQTEALFSIYTMIKPQHPLPFLGDWAISPDFAHILISRIYEDKPKTVLELGSGTSTLLAGYCMKSIGQGKIFSLENTEAYAAETKRMLKKHDLQNEAEILHAPLSPVTIGNENWLWYDTHQISGLSSIDLLIIDGPPKSVQKMARYPALPLLIPKLSENAVILLDDSRRKDEKLIINRWLEEFDELHCELVDTEKGTAVFQKTKIELEYTL